MKKKTKLLCGADEIAEYLGVSKHTVYCFIKEGMPAIIIQNKYHAHIDNIETYFQALTMQQIELQEGVE